MSLDAPRLPAAELRDLPGRADVVASETVFGGRVWDVRRDTLRLGEGQVVREYVAHTGAVAILAVVAAIAIGPLTTVLRAIADTF